jgi:acyl-coenzyme A thioesterase PaaI-like protein
MSAKLKKLPDHGACFVCGSTNPRSLGLIWYERDDGVILAEFTFTDAQQGPPAHVHGGASAAVLDEAMGAAVWRAGYSVAAVNLEINYKLPVPLGQNIIIEAHIAKVLPRKIMTISEMRLPDGSIAVTGRGIYVEAPHLFKDVSFGK